MTAKAAREGRVLRTSVAPLLGAGLLLSLVSCAEADRAAGPIHKSDPRVALDRPDTPGTGLQFHFDDDDDVETFASPGGSFVVHFARDGDHAVADDDEDASGIPDFVEEVAETYDEVLAFYEDLGFLAPLDDGDVDDNGGDDKFDVYLVDFAGVGDGTFRIDTCESDAPDRCAGFMTQENDYVGYGYPSTRIANRILASHEFFHAIQAAYDRDQGSVLAEGSAVWATEQFDPTLEDFEAFLPGFFENADRPLDEPLPGPVDPFSYGAAIYFQFLTEAYGDTLVRALWESLVDGEGGVADPQWMTAQDGVLQAEAGVSFADALTTFARWNLYTEDFADPEASYADGADYPRVKMESELLPLEDDSARVYHASAVYTAVLPAGREAITAAVVAPGGDTAESDGIALLIAREADGALETIVPSDPSAGTETVAGGPTARVIVVLVNTDPTGDSKKPGLCIGDVDEVAACKLAIGESATGSGGGQTTGAATTGSATTSGAASTAAATSGAGGAGDDDENGEDDGCGCSVPGSEGATSRAWIGAAALALYAARRARRRSATPSASS